MWYKISNFSKYEINETGQVRSCSTHKILSQQYDNRGYLHVAVISDNGVRTTKGVHRLLMETFCPQEGMENLTVNHINHIKDDNRLENLEWMKNEDNVKEAYEAGLHEQKHKGGNNKKGVRCVETQEEFESAAAAARAVNIISRGKIGDACKDPRKTCGGYHWEYIN